MPGTSVKFSAGSDDTLEILAIPFGGPLPGGRDTDGEFFSERTDLCADWYPVTRPLLYHHGLDEAAGVEVIGRVDSASARKDVDGWWVNAQLEKRSRYFDSIKRLIEQDGLSASSGAYPHLTKRTREGEIVRWPWVELSLTPTPANAYARVAVSVTPTEAKAHYKSAGITPPPTIDDDDTRSYADLLDRLTDEGGEFVQMTRRLAAGRTKVGRSLSQRRRDQLLALAEQWESGAGDLRRIVAEAETAPKPEERDAEAEPETAPGPALPETAAPPPEQQKAAEGDGGAEGAAAHAPPDVLAIFARFEQDAAFYGAVPPLHRRTA